MNLSNKAIQGLQLGACPISVELGSTLHSLQIIADTINNPVDPLADALVLAQHIDEAARSADAVVEHATEWSRALDRAAQLLRANAEILEKGDRT